VSDWQEAWEREKYTVGRAVHEAWAAEKQRQGFANHALIACPEDLRRGACPWPDTKHHPDMLDYDDLAPHVQEYDIQTGIVGYRFGFEAGRRSLVVREVP